MKKYLFLLILSAYNLVFGQNIDPKLKVTLDSVISISKDLSLYRNTVNWDSVEIKMYSAALEAKTLSDLKPSFEILLNELRDHHGNIRQTTDFSILAYFTDYAHSRSNDKRTYDPEIWGIVNDTEARFSYALLPNNIGYLKIVGIGANVDGQAEAERIRNALATLHNKAVEKWIVDLRYNSGGNINVMMAGIAPLFDTKQVASIRNLTGDIQGTAEIINENFSYFEVNAFNIANAVAIKNPTIAVLTSRWTASSGELVATAFKGQKNTRFFGEATGGYTTNNCWEIVNNEIAVVISTGVYYDRNGNAYPQNISADVEIAFEITEDTTKDKGIIAATNWLLNK